MPKTTLALSLLLLTVGCADDPGKDKVSATVEEVAPVAPNTDKTEPVAASGTQFAVDPAQSKLSCLSAKISAEHPIVFHKYDASITVDAGKVMAVNYTADMAKLEADHPRLTEHLLNEDFFWVEKFPTSSFRSTDVNEGSEAEGMTHTITGELMIRGLTKQVTFPANIAVTDTQATANTEFVINRKDFAIVYAGRKDDLIKDNVLLQVQFVAPLTTL